jgi:hypothetical protein
MAAPETMQARQAALLLHGLPAAVQCQVIAKLDAAESARLKPLLDELTQLGIAPSLGRQLQDLASLPQAPAPGERELTLPERVERLSAADVARCLQLCAPATAAQLLHVRKWSWRWQVLGLLPEAHRAQVFEHMRGERYALAPAVAATLCERLCRHAAQLPVDSPKTGGVRSAQPPAGTRSAMLSPIRARLRRLASWMR